ncbi:autotransporter outer membrane beta-barrel domain-containing protein [Azotobacter sp. CWF10]
MNWRSGGNGAGMAMDGERLQRQPPRDIYEAKAGVQVNLSGGWRGWGELSRQSGGKGFRDVGAQLGVSYTGDAGSPAECRAPSTCCVESDGSLRDKWR